MRRSTLGAVCLAAFLGAPSAFPGEESFSLDLSFESSDFPDLDANPVIDGAEGDSVRFTANLLLASAGLDGGPSTGVQGWSLSVWHAGVVAESLSVEGTVSARETEGGFLDDPKHSFLRFEVIDPERNNGRRGFIQAVVLSFQRQTVLPPNTLQVVGKVVYGSTIIPGGRVAFVRYEDGLVGSGRPVINVLTVQGQTITPSLAHRDITIGAGASPEICGDGADNDRDGWIDCNDPDCANAADCGAEVCGDGIDNDGDLLTDCADPDCARSSLDCREICADGRDNDGDGRVDCDDADCIGRVDCPALEVCGDGVDNDEDGATDCDDADCDGHPVCRVREDCQDGVDNDVDGRVDCDDSECAGIPPCP
ncbi:MAG: hypothetical protein O7J95_00805, partial [Planctomycetota bacterium]|nr:hypothetical protein [Planctomycetota bacterium]